MKNLAKEIIEGCDQLDENNEPECECDIHRKARMLAGYTLLLLDKIEQLESKNEPINPFEPPY